MNIQICHYQLKAKAPLNSRSQKKQREGALLKITFTDGLIGYADCHPWVELGDLSLATQLKLLEQQAYTNLTHCSMQFARLDAEARAQNKNLFTDLKVPLSHFLITDLLSWTKLDNEKLLGQGYTHVKIKVGYQLREEINHFIYLFKDDSFKLRIDFNEVLSEKDFQFFLKATEEIHKALEFIEDPFPFNLEAWKKIENQYHIALACDRQVIQAALRPDSTSFFVVKPAIQAREMIANFPTDKIVITSYLDHPFGQLTAAYRASQANLLGTVHGLLSHHAYDVNEFSQFLAWQGPIFIPPPGIGFGYDEQLMRLQWRKIL